MQEHERACEAFTSALDRLAETDRPAAAGGDQEDIDRKIRANVLGVLRSMYVAYHRAVWEGRGPTHRLGLDRSLPQAEQVATAFERFAAHLRESWESKEALDSRFGRDDDARKERVKLTALAEATELWDSVRQGGR